MYHLYGTQWSNIVDRITFASGTAAFLNTKKHFTNDVLDELYSFSELWVKEVRMALPNLFLLIQLFIVQKRNIIVILTLEK